MKNDKKNVEKFPDLPLAEWQATRDTLHLWTQIVGKIRMANTPLVNHFWNTTLYLSPRGLTTSAIPYKSGYFEMEFDFVNHRLIITTGDATKNIALKPQTVAEFYRNVTANLNELGIDVKIRAIPDELPDPIPFAEDTAHKSYDAEYANRFWRILVPIDKIFKDFRSRFIGKCSPVHFFWGSFDLAVTRFSGRRAPERAGADSITREAYSHEVISHGFWTGSAPLDAPAFYSYTAPEPKKLKESKILPAKAFYSKDFSEFIFKYDDMRQSNAPEKALTDFMQSTYEAGAELAKWKRAELERK